MRDRGYIQCVPSWGMVVVEWIDNWIGLDLDRRHRRHRREARKEHLMGGPKDRKRTSRGRNSDPDTFQGT